MNLFKKYRKQKNFSLDEVCAKLNYSRRIIEAIENDKVDFMEKPYNYYCAKNYSEFLGFSIPEDEILKYK